MIAFVLRGFGCLKSQKQYFTNIFIYYLQRIDVFLDYDKSQNIRKYVPQKKSSLFIMKNVSKTEGMNGAKLIN